MSKKRRKDKEVAKLRREVEVLRAQLAGQGDTRAARAARVTRETGEKEPEVVKEAPKTQPTVQSVNPRFIKADLLKSGILTLIALGAIVALTIIL